MIKTKALTLALVATTLLVTGRLGHAQSLTKECMLGGVRTEGDAGLALITSTGSNVLPCRVDLLSAPQAAGRGRTNYSNEDTGGVAGINTAVGPRPSGTLNLVGLAQAAADRQSHKSSIFSIELEANPAQSQLRVALVVARGTTSLEVTRLNQWTGEVENLGSLPVASHGTFELALMQNPRIAGLQLALTSGAVATTFTIDQYLGPKGLRGWRYGLLNDTAADNMVPYTWLMANGPKPTITVY